jgi:hypothetical protein
LKIRNLLYLRKDLTNQRIRYIKYDNDNDNINNFENISTIIFGTYFITEIDYKPDFYMAGTYHLLLKNILYTIYKIPYDINLS